MAEDLTGTRILEYRLERKLGEGGMGAVYLGRHELLGQQVALKILDPVLARTPELVERFIQEARIQLNLHHPNIVHLLTAVTLPPTFALVLEYVEGLPLDELIATPIYLWKRNRLHDAAEYTRKHPEARDP